MYSIETIKDDVKVKFGAGTGTRMMCPELKHYYIEVCQYKNEMSDFNENCIEPLAKDILSSIKIILNKEEMEVFLDIIRSMIKSIRAYTLHQLIVSKDEDLKKQIKTLYDEYIKLDTKYFDSKIKEREITYKNNYYEKAFLRRSFIQMYDWQYKELDKDVGFFIKEYEKYRLYYKSYKKVDWRGKECMICENPCVKSNSDMCDFCFEYNTIMVYIRLCKFFKVIGNYFLFKHFISDKALTYLMTHANYLKMFRFAYKFNTIKRYAYYLNLERSKAKEIEKEKIVVIKREDGKEEVKVFNSLNEIGEKSLV